MEIGLVAGARAIGFVAKHLGKSGEPDGIARFTDFPGGEDKIILEAKSSKGTTKTKDIDFASIITHMKRYEAVGCLLLAPGYQGSEDGNAATVANESRVSCWTVGQFADIVGSVESRNISARDVLGIVRTKFAAQDVKAAVQDLLAEPLWDSPALYRAIVRALRVLHDRLRDSRRTVAIIAAEVSGMPGFRHVEESDVRKAIRDLAGVSQGGLILDNSNVILNVSYDELERRVETVTRAPGRPRRMGVFAEQVPIEG